MVSQVNGRENQAAHNRKEEVGDSLFIATGQKENHQGNLSVPAGHAIPFVVFYGIQEIPDEVAKEASFQRDGLEMGKGKAGANGRKENVADK